MATTKESGAGLLLEWERMENVPPTSGLGGGVRGRHARSFCVCADTNKAQNWAGNESTGGQKVDARLFGSARWADFSVRADTKGRSG